MGLKKRVHLKGDFMLTAPAGHMATQQPQNMHWFSTGGFIRAFVSSIMSESAGHTSTHMPHPVHFLLSKSTSPGVTCFGLL
jgi:hypothetical protein